MTHPVDTLYTIEDRIMEECRQAEQRVDVAEEFGITFDPAIREERRRADSMWCSFGR